MRDRLERDAELRLIGADRTALEEQAGITAAIERAQEGQFMPDVNATSDEYWADHHDAVRRMTRDAYFGVQDLRLRVSLIALERRSREIFNRNLEADLEDAVKAVGVLEERSKRSLGPTIVMFTAGGLIAGAVGGGPLGALLGYFVLGNWHKQERLENMKHQLKSASEDAAMAKESIAEAAKRPAFLTVREEASGTRDENFDGESAYANLLQH